jgi:DNA replication and repair protein RecF
MRVAALELYDFRSWPTLSLTPGDGLNVLVGPNAQGKTNILEALYALATTKSHRTSRDADLVRFGAPAARVAATIAKESAGETLLELALGAPGQGSAAKLVKVNHGKQPRVTDLLGHLNAVLFASTDLDIIRGEPAERRQFLNYEIAQVSPRYVLALAAYRRALEQRNRLLKDIRHGGSRPDSLEAWSGPLIEHGARLIERREQWVGALSVHAATIHRTLTDGAETLKIDYQRSVPTEGRTDFEEIHAAFTDALAKVRREELSRGQTALGPQRDDLIFRIGPDEESLVDARTFGSQGQQRTVALALRLAERQLIEEQTGEAPIVLLDDVLSDLDETRRNQIFALALSGGQAFLTTTDVSALPLDAVRAATVFAVRRSGLTAV